MPQTAQALHPAFLHLGRRKPPRAAIKPTARVVQGVTLADDYAWLRAEHWRAVIENPETLPADISAYISAENLYAKAALRPLSALQKALALEMRGRMEEEESEPPFRHGDFLYYERYRKGQDYALACRKRLNAKTGTPGREEVLFDGQKEARDFEYFDAGAVEPSPNHALVVWAADVTGAESYTLRLRDLATGLDHDRLERSSGEVVWGRNSRFFYYIALDANQRPHRVMRHKLGEDQAQDEELFREEDTGWFVSLSSTQDERFLLIDIHDHETSECRLVDLADDKASTALVFPRVKGVEYELEHHEGRLILRSNQGGAADFSIRALPLGALPFSAQDWTKAEVLMPEVPGRIILSVNVLEDWLIWSDLGEAGPMVHVRSWRDGAEQHFSPRAPVGDISVTLGHEYASNLLRFTYSSPVDPAITLERDLVTGDEQVLKLQKVPSGHEAARYVTTRIFAPARDGETIPMTLLHLATTPLDGTAPALLYGYGAYGHALEADFEVARLSLVDRGFVYALAHVRGGMEKGVRWYKSGKELHKINTFHDFIDCAAHLVKAGYAAPHRIVAEGGSAGGLLMGGVANMAGEAFAGIIADVPFVDSLNTILDPELPLTPPEWVEWGNPITSKAAFDAMRAYSPYDNIAAKPYPPMLVLAGLSDPRVTYWEPAKFVAKLRATMTAGGPVLLHTNMGAGHGGASGRFSSLKDVARIYAFALAVVGLAGEDVS